MRSSWLVLAVTLALAPSAFAGRAKSKKPPAARKADLAQKRTRAVPAPTLRPGECTRVVLEDVPYQQLRLVGVVSQGRTQKAVLMDASDDATTITRGECIGMERVPYEDVIKPLRDRLVGR